jgi:glucose 1-dehydrogenase
LLFSRVQLPGELAEDRINVNNVAPGLIRTQMIPETLYDSGKAGQIFEHIPRRRAGPPDESARIMLFLASTTATTRQGGPGQWMAD